MKFCIEEAINIDALRSVAPSAQVDACFSDGSMNVVVADEDVDAMTDWCDDGGFHYEMVSA